MSRFPRENVGSEDCGSRHARIDAGPAAFSGTAAGPVALLVLCAAQLGCPSAGTPDLGAPPDNGTSPDQPPRVALRLIVEGITAPVALSEPDDGTGRLLIVEQAGRILVVGRDGELRSDPFLDIRERVVRLSTSYDERGLLGLALHPGFRDNGRFFVFYAAPPAADAPSGSDCEMVLSEFRASPPSAETADPDSERILLRIAHPQSNHKGGQLAFGPDGCLYIGSGDGGGAGDTGDGHTPGLGNAQDRASLLGKILRIDVDGGQPYAVPADNPFVDQAGAKAEIWAFGFRNPWRFAFDAPPGGPVRLLAGDVGQARVEEVDLVVRGGNYGWRIREGSGCFDPDNFGRVPASCPEVGAGGEPLIGPILEYSHAVGTSVIGGFVYRGAALPALRGRYVFGDFASATIPFGGVLFAAAEGQDGTWSFQELPVTGRSGERIGAFLYGFGQDGGGELYVLTSLTVGPAPNRGAVYKLVPPE